MNPKIAKMGPFVRRLLVRPGFSAIVIATLALGIGANTAIYSVAKAVVFTPLPFREPDALVHIFEGSTRDQYRPGSEQGFISVRGGTFHDWREQSKSFEGVAAARNTQVMLTGAGRTASADGVLVGEGLFDLFGVSPTLGRYFTSEDYSSEARVVVLGNRLWRERYSSDKSIIGRDILLDNSAYRVIGVMPAGFYPSRWFEPHPHRHL